MPNKLVRSRGNRSTANRASTTTTVVKRKRSAAIQRARLPTQGVNFREQHNTPVRIPKMSLHPNAIKEAVCSITNPFCAAAKNSKWPDGLGGETMTMQIRSHLPGAPILISGEGIMFVTPSLPYGLLYASGYTAPNFTLAATYSDVTAGSNFATYAKSYRVVSAGIIIRNVLPALTAQGYMIVSRLTNMPVVGASFAQGTTVGSDVATHPIVAGMEVPIIFNPTGMTARGFQTQQTNVLYNTGWDCIRIELVSVPVTPSAVTVIDVEFVFNVEFTLPDGQVALHSFVQPRVPNAPHAITASGKLSGLITSTAATSVESLGKMFLDKAAISIAEVMEGGLSLFAL
jgi:hypothetical protein